MRRLLLLLLLVASAVPAEAAKRPRIRAVTGFVEVERANWQAQFQEALGALRQVKRALEQGGYEVQTLRIATQPFPEYTRGLPREQVLKLFQDIEALAEKEDFLPALGPAAIADGENAEAVELLTAALQNTKRLHGTIVIADAQHGVLPQNLRAAARLIKTLADTSPGGYGNFNFAAIAAVGPHVPFFPAAYNQGAGKKFALAIEAASLVHEAFASAGGDHERAQKALAAALLEHARDGIEPIAQRAAQQTGWRYLGMDLSTAPLREVSVGAALESLSGAPFGESGTLRAAALATATVQAAPVTHSGYSGLMIPIMEDATLAQRWSEGHITIEALLAYSSVCGTGLDTIPLPGDIPEEALARILGDVGALAVRLKKPLTARLMPIKGKQAGEMTAFDDPYLVNVKLQPWK
jgi:uncharacterized protein (UPF0210 family)